MIVEITPSLLSGAVTPPASKSVAHRAFIAAACSSAPCLIRGNLQGDDVNATLRCLTALGATCRHVAGGVFLSPIGENRAEKTVLDVGASGSTFRFMLPLCTCLGTETSFVGSERLSKRPIGSLLNELKKHGLETTGDVLPFGIKGKVTGNEFTIDASVSSQYVTGLLLALPLLGGGTVRTVGEVVSSDYLKITLEVMHSFGVSVTRENDLFRVEGKYRAPEEYDVESDWSSAGFFAVAGAKGDVTLRGLKQDSTQGDKAVLSALSQAGAIVETSESVRVRANDLRGFVFDVENCPDAAPVLSVLAAMSKGKSVLTGTSRLRLKESDRAKEIVRMLTAFGIECKEYENRLEIVGGKLVGCNLTLPDDHRIAMSAAIAAANAEGKTVLHGAECVAKSYETFFDDFRKVGGKSNVLTV